MIIRSFILLWLAMPAFSQQTAVGRTTTGLSFDALHPGPAVNIPIEPKPSRPVLPPAEMERRTNLLPRRPLSGTPGVETVDLLAPGRSPIGLPRQPLALGPSASFEGIQNTNVAPADTDIAAGPDDLLLVTNAAIARYTKSGTPTSSMTLAQWFGNLIPTVCPAGLDQCRIFEPTVRYDSLHGRFLILAYSLNRATSRTNFLLSVSNGSSYASGWKNWAIEANLNGTTTTAFEVASPQMGYDNSAVYLTGNMFTSLTFVYAKVRILKKSELYNPATTALTWRDFWDLRNEDTTVVNNLRAVQLRGRAGAATTTAYLVNAAIVPNADYLTVWRIDSPVSDNPALTRTTIRGLWPYDLPAPFGQAGTTVSADSGDTRIHKAVVRNGILYTARNTGYVSDPTTVTYDRIDLAQNRFTLQSRLFNGTYFYPAFDIAASQGPNNALPNKLITGTSTDAAGTLSFAGISEVKAGEDKYEQVTDNRVRWGDYFGGAVDPVQGGLWVYGQYAKARGTSLGQWGSWASYFPWATSPQFTDVTSDNPLFNYINVMRQWSITGGCTASAYCPGANVTRAQMAVFVIRSIFGDTFTVPTLTPFTDVPTTHPFFNYIQKMRELGITSGCTATTYCPDANVTRAEMAVFLVRGKLKALLGDGFTFPTTPFFTDVPATHPFFNYVQKLRELGVTSGCTADTYCPDSPVTREQMAVFVVRSFLN